MTAQPSNLEIVQEIEDAFVRGDFPAINKWIAEDVVWIIAGSIYYPIAGYYYGLDKVEKAFKIAAEITKKDDAEVKEYIAQDNKVIVLGSDRGIAKPSNLPFSYNWAHLFILRDRKVVEFREYFTFSDPTQIRAQNTKKLENILDKNEPIK